MVATWKIKAVEELSHKMAKARTVGLVKITKIPSNQFQQMRKGLRGKVELTVAKGSIIRRAAEKANIKGLDAHVKGEVGVVLSDLDAFKLAALMKTTKTTAPAKPGTIAEKDIIIPAGDTPFKPGPIIGDLQKVGIKAKIQGGKIVVTDDSLVVKKGGVISADLANVLTRLDIQPVELGLTISSAYENGMIYEGDVLNIDTNKVLGDMVLAHSQAINLAYKAEIYNKETIKLFLHKAFSSGISLALNTNVVNKETIEALLAKANMQMHSVAAAAGLEGAAPAVEEKKKEEPKEEDAAAGLASLFG